MHSIHGASAPDAGKIDILNDAQVQFWTVHFSITETELRNAVFIAGPKVEDVRKYLSRKGKITRP